jgi:endo-1,4-beta-D-glucanase Y
MKKYLVICVCCLPLLTGIAAGKDPRKPFPQHVIYASNSIRPARASQAEQDRATLAFYREWRTHFTEERPDSMCRVICKPNEPGEYTVSEGQGYGMMIAVLMADGDKDAQPFFNRLYRFYKAHRCTDRGPHLMAGSVNLEGASTDANSAADGDLNIAYALLLAGRQWGKGTIDYETV